MARSGTARSPGSRQITRTAGTGLLIGLVMMASLSCSRQPQYPVLIANLGGDVRLTSLAWTGSHDLYYLTRSTNSSDSPDTLWIRKDGQQRLLYSFRESHLRWDKPCDNPFFTRLDARDASGVVALVDCLTQPVEIIVSVRDDGNAALLGRAPDAHDLAWRSGTDQGAVVVGSDKCRTVAPVIGRGVTRWSASA